MTSKPVVLRVPITELPMRVDQNSKQTALNAKLEPISLPINNLSWGNMCKICEKDGQILATILSLILVSPIFSYQEFPFHIHHNEKFHDLCSYVLSSGPFWGRFSHNISRNRKDFSQLRHIVCSIRNSRILKIKTLPLLLELKLIVYKSINFHEGYHSIKPL